MEVVIPVEIGVPSVRVENFDEQTNSEKLCVNLDLLEEVSEECMSEWPLNNIRLLDTTISKFETRSSGLATWSCARQKCHSRKNEASYPQIERIHTK